MADGHRVLSCYLSWAGRDMEGVAIRILVALEDDFRAYRDTISACLHVLRPQAATKSVGLEALEEEIERFEPQVVICSSWHKAVGFYGWLAWIQLSLDPTSSTKLCVRGRCFERTDLTVEELVEVIDEVE
jgi:hypothetical protein